MCRSDRASGKERGIDLDERDGSRFDRLVWCLNLVQILRDIEDDRLLLWRPVEGEKAE